MGTRQRSTQVCETASALQGGAHAHAVVALDATHSGPLLAVASDQHSLHVCNASEGSCVASCAFTDAIRCLAVHPSCNLVLVGLRSSVRLLEIFLCAPHLALPVVVRASQAAAAMATRALSARTVQSSV